MLFKKRYNASDTGIDVGELLLCEGVWIDLVDEGSKRGDSVKPFRQTILEHSKHLPTSLGVRVVTVYGDGLRL